MESLKQENSVARGIFQFIAILLWVVPVGYGLWMHNWFMVAGTISGVFAVAISQAAKKEL